MASNQQENINSRSRIEPFADVSRTRLEVRVRKNSLNLRQRILVPPEIDLALMFEAREHCGERGAGEFESDEADR